MYEIMLEEYERFLLDIKDPSYNIGKYLEDIDYEDEYCHNEIQDAKIKLIEKIREYLKENKPSQFILSDGWCVFVMTPDRARKSNISEKIINEFLVS